MTTAFVQCNDTNTLAAHLATASDWVALSHLSLVRPLQLALQLPPSLCAATVKSASKWSVCNPT